MSCLNGRWKACWAQVRSLGALGPGVAGGGGEGRSTPEACVLRQLVVVLRGGLCVERLWLEGSGAAAWGRRAEGPAVGAAGDRLPALRPGTWRGGLGEGRAAERRAPGA